MQFSFLHSPHFKNSLHSSVCLSLHFSPNLHFLFTQNQHSFFSFGIVSGSSSPLPPSAPPLPLLCFLSPPPSLLSGGGGCFFFFSPPPPPPHRRTTAAGTPVGPTRGQTDEATCGPSGFMRKACENIWKTFTKNKTRAYDRTNQGAGSGTNTRASTGTNRGRTSDKHAGVHRANTRIILHGPSGGQTCVDLRLCLSIADV